MNIFIDTEFTDFINCELISFGMVADDNRQFYGDRNDFNRSGCSDFVIDVVLPLLGQKPQCSYNKAELGKAVRAWLHQFKGAIIVICFDYTGDWELLMDLLGGEVPIWIQVTNIHANIDELQFEHFMRTLFDGVQHHALHDAVCNKIAFCETCE